MGDTYLIDRGHNIKLVDNGDGTFSVANVGAVREHTFHNVATVAADGAILSVGTGQSLTIEIKGTATARTVKFYGICDSGDKIPLIGINMSTLDASVSSVGTTTEAWSISTAGYKSIVVRIDEISGGNLTVKGRLVS